MEAQDLLQTTPADDPKSVHRDQNPEIGSQVESEQDQFQIGSVLTLGNPGRSQVSFDGSFD